MCALTLAVLAGGVALAALQLLAVPTLQLMGARALMSIDWHTWEQVQGQY
jgi:hypothetical protein